MRYDVKKAGAVRRADQLHWTARRRIMAILRASSRIAVFGRVRSVGPLVRAAGAAPSAFNAPTLALGLAIVCPLLGVSPAAAQTPYYSVNDGGVQKDNYDNDGATGLDSLAAGAGATATGDLAVSVGPNASASGTADIAIGSGANANSGGGTSALAIGTGASATNTTAVAVGYDANAKGQQSLAFGSFNTAAGELSVAIGNASGAYGAGSLALGSGAYALDTASIAIGPNALALTVNSIVLGQSQVYGSNGVTVGTVNLLLGDNSGAFGNSNTTGDPVEFEGGTGAYAIGNNNIIAADNAFVLGNGVVVAAGLDGAVVLGNASTVTASSPTSTGIINGKTYSYAGGAPAPGGVVSMGAVGAERQIQNVAAGRVSATSTDAINGSQLFATNSAIEEVAAVANEGWNVTTAKMGSGTVTGTSAANVSPGATQTITAGDNIAITQSGGNLTIATNPNLIVTSLTAGNTVINNSGLAITGGPSITTGGINAGNLTITNVQNGVNDNDAVNLSQLNTAVTNVQTHYYSVNDGGLPQFNFHNEGAQGFNSIAVGVGAAALKTNEIAIGYYATSSGPGGIAIGEFAGASGESDVYIGGAAGTGGIETNYRNSGIGEFAGANVSGNNNSAMGASTGKDVTGIGNFAGGAYSGSIVTGNYNIAIGGVGTVCNGSGGNNLMTGCEADGIAAGVNVTGSNNIALGQVAGSNLTGDNNIAFGNQAGVAVQANDTVSMGTLALASRNQAVAIGANAKADQEEAVALGAGSVTSAPVPTASETINGITYNYAGINPISSVSVGTLGKERQIQNVAAGQVTATSTDAINGSQLFATNAAIADIVAATGKGWNVTTASTGSGTATGSSVANVAPGATLTIIAGNNIAITQNGKGLTVATNPDLVSDSLTAGNTKLDTNGVVITGGANGTVALTGSGLDNGGNKIVNVAAGTVNSTSTDAVNGSQLHAVGSSTASALGGTSIYNSATGQVTAGLSVGGNNYTNVQDALSAVNTTASAGWNVTSGSVGTGTAVDTGAPANVAPGASAKFTAGNNIALTQNGTEIQVAISANVTVDSVTVNGGPTMDSNGIAMAGDKITGLAAGTISAASTDGVNGSQLFAAGTSIASSLGGGSTFDPVTGTVTANLTVGGNIYNNVQDALNSVSGASAGWNVATHAVGSGTATNLGGNATVAPGGTATFAAGNNISVTQNGTEVQVALKDDVSLNSVTANVVTINGGPTINSQGITMGANDTLDMAGGKITNVAAGTTTTDAVNLGQLNQGMATTLNSANAYTDSRVNALSFDLGRINRDARGGTAGAMAMSQVPQAFEPGMGIVGMGVSTFMGEQSIAVGYSKASDNGRVVVKATGSYNSRGQGGVAAGVGLQF